MPCAAILRIKTQHGVASIQGRLGNPSRNCSIRPSKNTVALTASTGVAQAFNLHLSCVSHQQNQRLVGVRVSNMIAVSPLSALRQYVGRVYTVTGEAQSSSCVRLIASNLSRHGSGGVKAAISQLRGRHHADKSSGLLDLALPVVMFGLRQPSQSRVVKGFDTFSFHHIRFASTFRQPR